ncbi:hypothetical protein CPB85DRAFT_195761 [Mucidula mucida]|nr:hypothetical protein CPB85DRAFT_195761 [Mucidula mucida]
MRGNGEIGIAGVDRTYKYPARSRRSEVNNATVSTITRHRRKEKDCTSLKGCSIFKLSPAVRAVRPSTSSCLLRDVPTHSNLVVETPQKAALERCPYATAEENVPISLIGGVARPFAGTPRIGTPLVPRTRRWIHAIKGSSWSQRDDAGTVA